MFAMQGLTPPPRLPSAPTRNSYSTAIAAAIVTSILALVLTASTTAFADPTVPLSPPPAAPPSAVEALPSVSEEATVEATVPTPIVPPATQPPPPATAAPPTNLAFDIATTAPVAQEPDPPIFEKWWFWTAIGAFAVTAVVIVATSSGPTPPRTDLGNMTAF